MEHILNLEQVKKYYGGNSGNITKAVDGISMYVDKGEFVAIMGASGSGKTTLLNCISTIDTVTSGHITVNNQDITKIKDKDFADFRRENLGFIFQDFNLLDTLTIEENISLSLVINKRNPADIDKRVHAIADKLGIRDILSKFPYEVSGGQKQRCACARALINEPKLILADEPTGALDSKSSRLLLETMSDINKKMQATILMAVSYTHLEAYKLDFINDMADSIGKSIQTLAGVTQNGFSSSGFYVGFLLLIILVVGLYVAYTGLIKRETSKALHAVINFVVVFVLSASFIAYAPDYIKKINEFSSDISTASLDLGTKIMLPNSDSEGKDSVDLIRDSLFSIQVEQPWLLLQFGNSNAEEIGTDRVDALVSASPEDEDGKTREEVVKTEIEDNDNNNLTIPQVVNRLGMVFFLLFFNLGITIFVFLLTGMMLFSQILFIIFAMFLPISFLLSMIPSYESMVKQAIVRAVSYTHLCPFRVKGARLPTV